MGGKRRNKNKSDRDELAVAPSSSRQNVARTSRQTNDYESDGDDDAESVTSHLTLDDDLQSVMADNELDDDGEDNTLSSDLSSRLSEYLDNATNKNISIRLAAMNNIQMMLMKNYMIDELEKWTKTITEFIEKTLKKTDEEAYRAAVLLALICVQLGDSLSDQIEPMINILIQISTDSSRCEQIRVQCLNTLSICAYMCVEQASTLSTCANSLRSVWITTKSNAISTSVFSAALAGWSLLINQAGRRTLESALLDEAKLCAFIDGAQVDMRLSAGESLSVLYETAIETMGVAYRFPNHQHLLELLESLSTDSLKYRAKKERRVQRFSFRQIYNFINDQTAPSMKIRFSGETLELDSCGKKLLYDLLCGVLRGGMNIHLKSNPMLREIFDLGPVPEHLPAKMNKLQRMAIQNALSKTRDLQRAKQRDKRSC